MFDDIEGPPEMSMVRVLLILAIGIPILIEVVTFGGLIGHYAGGGGADAAATPTPEPTDTDTATEILPRTEPTERISSATVQTGGDDRQFVLTVDVTDVGTTYELQLGAVTTRNGTTISGRGSTTGTLSTGESGTVTGIWLLPAGERPDTLTVTAVTTPANGTASASEYTVDLGDVSVAD